MRHAAVLLRAVVEGTTDAIYVKDCDGRHLLVNQAAARFVGRPVAEVLGRDAYELFEPADAERLIASDRSIMAGVGVVALEETLAADGVSRTYHATKAPYRDASGNVIGLIGISRDITERKRAEEALRQSEARFRQLADAIPQIVWMAGPDGGLVHVNAWAETYLGRSSESLHGWNSDETVHPEDLPALVAARSSSVKSGVSRDSEFRIRRADGEYRWHVNRQVAARADDGKVVGWYGTCTDIDDLKRTETAFREIDARLREAQRIAHLGSWIWEPQTDQVWWSDAEFELFGADPAVIRPSFEAFLALVHPEDRSIAVDRVKAMLAGANEFANEMRIVRPEGDILWIHSRARATRDAAGMIVRVEGTDQDITDQRLAKIAAWDSERRLQLALEAAGAIAFVWDMKNDSVTRYFSTEPALPVTVEWLGPLAEVRARVHPDDRTKFDARLDACLTEMAEYRNEYRVIRPDGTTAYLEEYGFVDRGADGSPLRLTGMSIDVTERVTATDALRASEERFQEAARVAGVGVFEHDHLAETFFWSPRLREIYGYDPDAPVNLNEYLALIHPDDRDSIATAIRKAHDPAGNGRFDVSHRMVRPTDGRVLWLTTQSKTRFAGEGPDRRPVRTVGATVDVTDTHEAAEALRQSEERYRLLVDTLPTSVHVIDGGRLTFCNPSCVALFGAASEAELLDKTPFDLVHPDSNWSVTHRIPSNLATPAERVPYEVLRIARMDGQVRTVHAVATRIPNGRHPDAHLVCLNDITEQERSGALLRSVLGSVGDAILTIDAGGIVTSANRSTERLFGYAASELLGGNVSVLMPEPHRGEHNQYISAYLRTGVAKVIGVGRELEGRRKDGTTFPVEITVTEFSRDGERHFTGVIRDITARRRLEEQFRQAQKMEAVGRLAGGVAHDFNNMLTVINSYTEILIARSTLGDPAREMLSAILDACERAAQLTKQLLAFSRKSLIAPRQVDLNEIVAQSSKLIGRLIGEDIALTVLADQAPVWVVIDPGQLGQVLLNLAVNARDAMPAGGRLLIETRTVELAAVADRSHPDLPPGRYASLRVSDTGCGISDKVRDKIFEPFFTTKGVGIGTGLGLSVVHGAVQQAGGSIAVESAAGAGTTFNVLFPVVAERAELAALAAGIQHDPGGTETVLVVEDEDAVRTLVRLALEERGYTVLTASNSTDALDLLKAQSVHVDLLLTDVIMPGMSGRELAEKVMTARPGLRVLYMSGYTDDALGRHGLQWTVDQFIQKPFTPLSLVEKVRAVLASDSKIKTRM